MADAVERVEGRIVGYDRSTHELLIRAPYSDENTLQLRKYDKCAVELRDDRKHSSAQVRTVYALLRCISRYSGMDIDETKKTMKYYFLEQHPEYEILHFSLADADMSLVREFQKYLVRFIVQFDIPCEQYLADMVSDTDDFIYACLKVKKCCVCGAEDAELHFIGGYDVENGLADPKEGMRVLPLCQEHHKEADMIGRKEFSRRYHISHGVKADQSVLELYIEEPVYSHMEDY